MSFDDQKKLDVIKAEIERFRHEFGDKPIEHIKEGSWFSSVIQRLLTEHAQSVNAEYFIKKYPGLDRERIAYRLIETASTYAGLSGTVAAGVVTASELSTIVTGGWSLTAAGASLLGEIAYTTYIQLKLVYDISVVLDASLDKDDPEDILTIFWYAFGINRWQYVSDTLAKGGPRVAEYQGRKFLRSGVTKAIQKIFQVLGGKKLAQKRTEKTLLKLLVPGINLPIAYYINKKFTKLLGKKAIRNFKNRSIAIKPFNLLMKADRHIQLLALPLIFHIGIADEPKDISSEIIEVQTVVTRKLGLIDGEDLIVSDLIESEYEDFLAVLSQVKDKDVTKVLYEIGLNAYVLSKTDLKRPEKLKKLASCLSIDFEPKDIGKIKQKFA